MDIENPFESVLGIDEQAEKSTPKKRGRKPGSSTTKTAAKTAKKQADISGAILTVGAMLAAFTSYPELAPTEEEGKALSEATDRLLEYYELPDLGVGAAWVNLAIVIGGMGYTRFAYIKADLKDKADKEAKEETEKPVIPEGAI